MIRARKATELTPEQATTLQRSEVWARIEAAVKIEDAISSSDNSKQSVATDQSLLGKTGRAATGWRERPAPYSRPEKIQGN